MKKAFVAVVLCCAVTLMAVPARAVTLSLTPASQIVDPGTTAFVGLLVSGLPAGTPPSSLGAFSLDVAFDSTVLTPKLTGPPFLSFLGNPTNALETNIVVDTSVSGKLHLEELSLLPTETLDRQQPAAFGLAFLPFATVNIPNVGSILRLENVVLSNALGDELSNPTLNNAQVITSPEPTTCVFFGTGLAGLLAYSRWRRKRSFIPLRTGRR